MRRLILALFGAGALSGCASAPALPPAAPDGPSATAQYPALRDILLAMEQADQEARTPLTTAFRPGEQPDSATMAAIAERITTTDSMNLARLKQIVEAHGWPGVALVGRDGANAVFLLVQHADRDVAFQKEYLAWLERAFRAGELSPEAGEAVALLTDRVRRNEGRPQLYGTQVELREGSITVLPLEDAENADARRAALGLPPLAEYLKLLRKAHGIPE
jgi:hypothetical protein